MSLVVAVVASAALSPPSLAGTTWRIGMDVGRIPGVGTWMPASWAASGARLGISGMEVEFQEAPRPEISEPRLSDSTSQLNRLHILTRGSFVGPEGREEVVVVDGAWSIVPAAGDHAGANRLRFFIEFPEGAKRSSSDCDLPAGRVFFTTAVFGPTFEACAQSSLELQSELEELTADPMASNDMYSRLVAIINAYSSSVQSRKQWLRAQLRARQTTTVDCPQRHGLKIATAGSLNVKRERSFLEALAGMGSGPKLQWGEAMFTIGQFTMTPTLPD